MSGYRPSSEILLAMAAEAEGAAEAAEQRAKMQDRAAEKQPEGRLRQERVLAAGRDREAAAFHLSRAQALRDGARLLATAEARAA